MILLMRPMQNQEGFMLVVTFMILTILSIIGIAAISTSNTEQEIAGSEQMFKMAFFAAEAGRAFVIQNPDLYHDENLQSGVPLSFPDQDDGTVRFNLADTQSFSGTVEYRGASLLPRGSGFEAGDFKAHNYLITSNGSGPRKSISQVEEGFYRVGF